MQVISSSQSVQLAHFPDLNPISKYGEANTVGSYDFQFLRQSPLFILSSPEHPIEYLSKRTKHDNEEIFFVRRIRTDIANTVACPNYSGNDIAVGTSTGYIQMYHYKTMDETAKFSPPTMNDAAMALSFNCQDDILASLHESGAVQLFGLKTSARTDLLTFDKEVTHIRFHPKRRLQLGMVSYSGNIHIYDTQSKKRVFSHMAHQAPCRDLAMSPVNDHCLVTVGYDHLLNLYDTRTKIASVQLSTAHPLSAVAISPCGSFTCVGNLKGQLLGYDFRQLKEPLIQTRQCHSGSVKRVEFLGVSEEDLSLTERFPGESMTRPSGRRDSMQQFFDHHYKQRAPEQRKFSNLFSAENSSGTRISIGMGNDLKLLLCEEQTVRSRATSTSSSSSSDVEFVGFTPGQREAAVQKGQKNAAAATEPKTPLVSITSSLSKVAEGKEVGGGSTRSSINGQLGIPQEEYDTKMINRPVRKSIQTSTPLNSVNLVATPTTTNSGSGKKHVMPDKYLGDGDSLEHKGLLIASAQEERKPVVNTEELEGKLNERIDRLEKTLEFRLEQSSWELKNYNTLVYMKQMEAVEELQKQVMELTVGMNCLIRSDEFMDEFFRLRQENEELKARLMGNGH